MATYTPTASATSGARIPWPIDKPLCRLEISKNIPTPIKYEEDNTTYTVPIDGSFATTHVGTGWIQSGRTYLLSVTVRYQMDDAGDDLVITMLERSTGSNVVMDGSKMKHLGRQNPPTNHYSTYTFVTQFTASSTSTNGPIVYLEHTGAGTATSPIQDYAQMILFDLTDMTEGNDYFYEENSTDASNTTTPVTRESATLNLTKDNKGLWLLGAASQYKCNNDNDYESTVIIRNQDASILGGDVLTLDTSETNDEDMLTYTTLLDNDLSDTSWDILLKTSDETAAGRGVSANLTQHNKVFGIRLGKFVSSSFSSNQATDTSATNNTKTISIELTGIKPQYDSPNYLVLHGGLANFESGTAASRKKVKFFTDVQWKNTGGTYARYGDDDQQAYSTLIWRGNTAISADYDDKLPWLSTVPPTTLSGIGTSSELSFKLEIWKSHPTGSNADVVEGTDIFLGVIELPPDLDYDDGGSYVVKANHSTLLCGPTTLEECINTRNRLLEARGFRVPEKWDTVWTKQDIEKT